MIDPDHPDYTNTPVSPRRPPFGYIPADPTSPPAASILTTFFNTGPVFHETAQSVMQQSLQQWEWLIVNDCSTSAESLSILDHYRRLDPRIHVIDHPQNKGPAAARNTGFAAAQTDIVVQLDSDDLLEPTAVEKWVWLLTSYPEYAFANGYSVLFQARQSLFNTGFSSPRAFLLENEMLATCAVRASVHRAIGGYDETIHNGFDDADFWLRCANAGRWGARIPEYTDWYRQRENHGDRWLGVRSSEHTRRARQDFYKRYPRLWQENSFPSIPIQPHLPYASIPTTLPCANQLRKEKSRLLMLTGKTDNGGLAQEHDTLEQFVHQNWEVSIVVADGDSSCLPVFTQHTPDVFVLPNFLRSVDYPRFLRYLIQSRQVDAVVLFSAELGYLLLPYLRSCAPQTRFIAFCNADETAHDDLTRLTVAYQPLLDLIIVPSDRSKRRLMEDGVAADCITVCDTNGVSQSEDRGIVPLVSKLTQSAAHDTRAIPAIEIGQLFAFLAVEHVRRTADPRGPIDATSQMRQPVNPIARALKGLLNRFVLWSVYPDPRLATLVRLSKRLVPTALKVALKRRAK